MNPELEQRPQGGAAEDGDAAHDAWPDDVPRPPSGDELPSEDDEPMESDLHRAQLHLTVDYSRQLLSNGRGYATGNLGFYFSAEQARGFTFRAPDVMLFLGAEDRLRKSWVVWEEGGKGPDVVIELLSDKTRKNDLGPKRDTYASLRIPEYFTWDPFSLELTGWRLEGSHYARLQPGPDGRLPSQTLGVSLGGLSMPWGPGRQTFLRFFSPDGSVVPTQAEAEAQRADTAERELALLRAELQALKASRGG
jgi:Uma2 family endonuclease